MNISCTTGKHNIAQVAQKARVSHVQVCLCVGVGVGVEDAAEAHVRARFHGEGRVAPNTELPF